MIRFLLFPTIVVLVTHSVSLGSPSQSQQGGKGEASAAKSAKSAKSAKPVVKLKNIALVVDDPSSELNSKEKLVPVDPVELRAKPKPVAAVHMQSGGVKLPSVPVLENLKQEAPELVKVGAGERGDGLPPLADLEKGEGATQEDVSPRPLLVNAAKLHKQTPLGVSYSPFEPPPPGFIPSTLVGSEPLVTGESLLTTGVVSPEEQRDLSPLSAPVPSGFGGGFIPRATLAHGGQENVFSSSSPGGPFSVSGQNPHSQFSPAHNSSFLTDSEAQAIVDIAGSAGDAAKEQEENTVIGQTW